MLHRGCRKIHKLERERKIWYSIHKHNRAVKNYLIMPQQTHQFVFSQVILFLPSAGWHGPAL